jgi:PRTRC genetic system protein C
MTDPKTVLQRKFKMGATVLADPNASWSPEQVLAAYAPNYPFLASATLSEPVVEGDFLIYHIVKPAVQTKGSAAPDPAIEDALARIASWGGTAIADPQVAAHWEPVLRLMERRLDEGTNAGGLFDPLFIPLA